MIDYGIVPQTTEIMVLGSTAATIAVAEILYGEKFSSVYRANDHHLALAVLKRSMFGLIFSELKTPAVDGLEFLRRLRSMIEPCRHIPVIVLAPVLLEGVDRRRKATFRTEQVGLGARFIIGVPQRLTVVKTMELIFRGVIYGYPTMKSDSIQEANTGTWFC